MLWLRHVSSIQGSALVEHLRDTMTIAGKAKNSKGESREIFLVRNTIRLNHYQTGILLLGESLSNSMVS